MKLRPITLVALIVCSTARGAPAQATHTFALPLQTGRVELSVKTLDALRELSDGLLLILAQGQGIFVVDFNRNTVEQVTRSGRGPKEYMGGTDLIALGADSTIVC